MIDLGAFGSSLMEGADALRPRELWAPSRADAHSDKQWSYIASDSRFNALMCARQWGKTSGSRLRAARVLARGNTRVIYATLIRRNCKKLFWQPLLYDVLEPHGWDVSAANGTDLLIPFPNGSWLQALACDDLRDLKTIRGDQADLFIIDECQEPNDDVLEALVIKIALPMLLRRKGMLDLCGTVPEVEPCFFSRKLDDPAWKTFGETSTFDNPTIDRDEIDKACAEAGIGPGHPIYEREIMGRRVRDPSKLAYEYVSGRNDYNPAEVDFNVGPWRHSLGLDLGFQDNDAIVVNAWNRDDGKRRLYARFVWQRNHLDIDDLELVLRAVLHVYRPAALTGDHGGHGATKVMATLEHRLHASFMTKPPSVDVSVGLVNDDLRTSRLLLPTTDVETEIVIAAGRKMHGAEPEKLERFLALMAPPKKPTTLAAEMAAVTKTVHPITKKYVYNKGGKHSDLSEAERYAHAAARHFCSKDAPPEKTLDQRRLEWIARKRKMAGNLFGGGLR